ncbi:MAG: hypothetical protein DMD37_13090, partial [Gemmatimonadetes bacterium]
FTHRFLNKASATHRMGEYATAKTRLGTLLPGNPRLWVHAEDFINLLYWMVLRLRGGGRTVSRELLGKTLLLAVPLEDIVLEPMFAELLRRLS